MATQLKIYEVEYDGKIYEIEAPDGTPEEDIFGSIETYNPQDTANNPAPSPAPLDTNTPDPGPAPTPTAVAQPVPQQEELLPNAIRDASRETTVQGLSMEEIPGAREDFEKLFWNPDVDFSEARRSVQEMYPGLELPENMAGVWAENRAFAGTPEGRAFFRNNSPFAPVVRETGLEDPSVPDGVLEEAFTSAGRSLANMANTAVGAAGLAADVVGADETAEGLLDKYLENQAKISLNYPSSAGRAVEIDSLGDAGRWAASVLGELAPQITASMGTGAIGGMAARRVAERRVADIVGKQVALGKTQDEAEKVAADFVRKMMLRGQVGGAAALSEVQEVGSTYGDTYAKTGERRPIASLAAGTAAAALDTVLPARIFSKLGGGAARDAFTDAGIKRFGREAFTSMVLEGGTEAVQTILEQLPSGDVDWDEVIEAGFAGALGGGAVGTAMTAYEGIQDRKTARDLPPAAIPQEGPTIPVPTAGRRTKKYKEEISAAATGVVDKVNILTSTWENAPEFEVHDSFKTVPGVDTNAIGAASGGKVLLSTENILKEAAARNVAPEVIVSAVTYHEGLGHHGLDQLFGENLDAKLAEILSNSPVWSRRTNEWMNKNKKAYVGEPNRDLLAFEEVLAEMSEKGQMPVSIVNYLKNVVKDFGRRMGLDLEYSTREVETILGMAHAAVVNGKRIAPRENGYRFMMAGRKAETANSDLLRETQLAAARGKDVGPSGETRKTTGWFKGPDGKYRFEIDDSKASVALVNGLDSFEALRSGNEETYQLPLNEVLDHPELFEAYPQLSEYVVSSDYLEREYPDAVEGSLGFYDPESKLIYINSRLDDENALSTLLHETQHAIQDIEGFATGGSPQSAILTMSDELLVKGANQYLKWLKTEEAREAIAEDSRLKNYSPELLARAINKLLNELNYFELRMFFATEKGASIESYRHLFGEVEARDTEARRNMTPEERRDTTPYQSEEDIDSENYIIDTDGGGRSLATVWHGSPYDFDEFDHSKMGTGEGAQVYGWGTYLTETQAIAAGYREALSDDSSILFTKPDGTEESLPNYYLPKDLARILDIDSGATVALYPVAFAMDQMSGGVPLDEAIDAAIENYEHFDDLAKENPKYEGWRENLEKLRAANPRPEKPGRLYEVELPDEVKWVEWDKPLAEMDPEVQQILKERFYIGDADRIQAELEIVEARLEELVNQNFALRDRKAEITPEVLRTTKGKELYEVLDKAHERGIDLYQQTIDEKYKLRSQLEWATTPDLTGKDVYESLIDTLGSPALASQALFEAGIVGNKYLDGNSRSAGEGSYNYVVFHDKTPKIRNKYMMLSSPDKVEMTEEEIANMTADELLESDSAMAVLETMTRGYTPTVMSYDDLQEEARARGIPVSRILRNNGIGAGEITRRLFMYDIAMGKINDQLSSLWIKLNTADFTPSDQAKYVQLVFKQEELAGRIFEDQAEIGRALNAMKQIVNTRRRVNGTLETLAQFKKGSPFEVLNDPTEFYKFAQSIQNQIEDNKKTMKERGTEWAGNALNLPRALMSSVDFSAPLRQGIFLIHKKAWWSSFFNMFRYAGSEETFNDLMDDIANRPTYREMLRGNLALSNVGTKLTQREEDYMSEWAERIPGIGRLVKASERAYVGFLNKLRADVFDQLYENLPDNYTEKDLRDISGFINAASGRGDMPKTLQSSVPLLNALFFSPRLIASRLKMSTVLFDPRTYTTMNKTARMEYIKALTTVGSLALLITTIAVMAGADVEDDPRSSDFAKVKVDNTRYDILGGEGQYITLGARLVRNSYKTTDGDIKPYGNKFGQTNQWDAIMKFFTNKTAPVPSFVIDYFRGVDATGKKFEMDKALAQRFVPMFVQDVSETVSEVGPEGFAMSAPGLFGIGVQTYTSASMDTERELEPPDDFSMKSAIDGEYNNATVIDGTVYLNETAKKEWGRLANIYYKDYMKEELADPAWKTLDDATRREIIKDVRKDARADAKADMLEFLEIQEVE